jgi:hypothetical protein
MEQQSLNQKKEKEEENSSAKKPELKEEKPSKKSSEITKSNFLEEFKKAKAFQIMGQQKPKK